MNIITSISKCVWVIHKHMCDILSLHIFSCIRYMNAGLIGCCLWAGCGPHPTLCSLTNQCESANRVFNAALICPPSHKCHTDIHIAHTIGTLLLRVSFSAFCPRTSWLKKMCGVTDMLNPPGFILPPFHSVLLWLHCVWIQCQPNLCVCLRTDLRVKLCVNVRLCF